MSVIFEYSDNDFFISHAYTKNPLEHSYRMHTHDTTEIFLFLKGSGVYHVEGSVYNLESGDVLVMRPEESHYIELEWGKPYERVVINFKTDIFSSLDSKNILQKPILERKAGKLNIYKSYEFKNTNYRKCFENMEAPDGEPRINILSNLLVILNDIYTIFNSRVEDNSAGETLEYSIIRYINKHLSSQISLDSICEKYFISKAQLCRIFKKATGTTVWQYITLKRLLLAKQMLNMGNSPTQVYSKCGFSDYSTFYRAYIKRFGKAPKDKN